jgi:hypothetical protein
LIEVVVFVVVECIVDIVITVEFVDVVVFADVVERKMEARDVFALVDVFDNALDVRVDVWVVLVGV